jgi:hypothetical protein
MGIYLYINLKFNGSNTLLLSWEDRATTRYGPQVGPPVATTKLVVVVQHPTMRRDCLVVAHAQTDARRLPNVWLALFLLVFKMH